MTKTGLIYFFLVFTLSFPVFVSAEVRDQKQHWVQIFASTEPGNLQKFLEKHQDIGNLQVVPYNRYSRVVVGPFNSFREADQSRDKLLKRGHLQAFVRTSTVIKPSAPAIAATNKRDTSKKLAETDEPQISIEQSDQLEDPAADRNSSLIASTPYLNDPAKLADVIAQIKNLDAETRRELLGEYFPREFGIEADEEYYGINYASDF